MTLWDEIATDANRGAERLIAEYGDRLYNSAVRLCGNEAEAEDLVFKTFSQVITHISSFSAQSTFYTWIYSIMLNFRRMDMRKKGSNALEFPKELPEVADLANGPEEIASLNDDIAEVRKAIASLDESYREVVVMYYFDDMEVADISIALGIPLGSVKSRLHRARGILFRKLQRTNPSDAASK